MAAQITKVDFEAFPMDRALPQVRIASDESRMRAIFQECLNPVITNLEIKECVLTRIRYRPAARCILQYRLLLKDSNTGRERVQWASCLSYPSSRAKHVWKKLQKEISESSIAGHPFEPVLFIPELNLLLQFFPYDHHLPGVAVLVNGRSEEMESLLQTQFGSFPWHVQQWSLIPVRYRTGLASVLRYKVHIRNSQSGEEAEKHVFAKIYKDNKGEEVFKILQALSNDGSASQVSVARPIAYLSNLRVLVQESASGTSFQQILIEGPESKALLAARKLARALADLHLNKIHAPRRHEVKDEVALLESRGRTLKWSSPALGRVIDEVVRVVTTNLTDTALRPCHLDLNTDHILFDRDRCILLDFDSFALADPILDVAHVLAQIKALNFRFKVPVERLQRTCHALTGEYFAITPGEWQTRLPVYYAGAVLNAAVGFFRRQELHWPTTVAALVAEARASLGAKDFLPMA